MWNLLTPSTLRDVSIFLGAYLALQTATSRLQGDTPVAFADHPLLVAHGFVPLLQDLKEMSTPQQLKALLDVIEEFLELCVEGNVHRNGFRANRLLHHCMQMVRSILNTLKSSSHHRNAMDAIAYETDNAPVIEAMLNDALRNMLLDGVDRH